MISIQIDIDREQIEDAILDMSVRDIKSLIVSVVERSGDPGFAKELIGKLGDTYTYLEEMFGE